MIPSRFLLTAVFVWVVGGFVTGWLPALLTVWAGCGAALLLLAVLDLLQGRPLPALELERDCAGVWAVERWHDVRLTLRSSDSRTLRLVVFDDCPAEWELAGQPHVCTLAAGTTLHVTYRLRPLRRGDGHFGPAWLRITSPLGLWQVRHRLGPRQVVKVFPDYSRLLGHSLHATDRRTNSAGVLRKRRRGEGTDFRQLRDYRDGDSLRAVDWCATARMQKPITREYQEERDQQVVFLLDSGRRMLAIDDGIAHFDHALHAILSLAFVAQKQGDAIGLLTFGGTERWIAPYKGRTGLDRLLAGIYDVHAAEVAPDYVAAASELMRRLHKRAFIVLVTNLRDEDERALRTAVELLSGKHLVMCASLREKALDNAMREDVLDFEGALRLCSAQLYLQQREQAIRRLGVRKGHLIDVTPDHLPAALMNRYLDIKESGQL